jgi:diacylglycerol kinase family enzyme
VGQPDGDAVMRKPHVEQLRDRRGTEITVTFDKKRRFELDGGVKGKSKKLEFEIRPAHWWCAHPPSESGR